MICPTEWLSKAALDLLKPSLGMIIEPNRDDIDKIASQNISLDTSLSGDPQDDKELPGLYMCVTTIFIRKTVEKCRHQFSFKYSPCQYECI